MAAFYLDEDAPEALASLLATRGHSATTTRAEGYKGAPDYEQLWRATLRGWLLVTLNRRDYELLHGAWRYWTVRPEHAGVLVTPHVPRANLPAVAEAIDALVANPDIVLSNALHIWTARTGWHASSR